MKTEEQFYLNVPIVGSLLAATAIIVVFVFTTFQTKSDANAAKESLEDQYSIIREDLNDIKKDVREIMKRVK